MWHGIQGDTLVDYLRSQIDDTDVFCFQEANGPDAEQVFAQVFGDNTAFNSVTHDKITDAKLHYNLRTYVRSSLEVTGHSVIIDRPDKEGTALRVDLLAGQAPLSVINAHGAPYPGDKLDNQVRLEQSKSIIDATTRIGHRHVICGDFNLLPDTESVGMFAANGYQDLIEDYAIATTRNHLAWDRFPDSKQLYADYAFASPELKVNSFEVPDSQASDHLPLEIDINLD